MLGLDGIIGSIARAGRVGIWTGEPLIRFPWTWALIEPQYRYIDYADITVDHPSESGKSVVLDRIMVIATCDEAIRYYLDLEYERQLRDELIEPEWPCEYYELLMEARGET